MHRQSDCNAADHRVNYRDTAHALNTMKLDKGKCRTKSRFTWTLTLETVILQCGTKL